MTTLTQNLFHSLSSALFPWTQTGFIGVDIGTHSTKIAQVERDGSDWRAIYRTTIATPPGQFDRGTLTFDWLKDELQDLVGRRAFVGRAVACVLPLSIGALRTMDLPQASADELNEIVTLELKDEAGFEHEFVAWDWKNAERTDGAQPYSVVSVTSESSDAVADALCQSGCDCRVLDALPYSLARTLDIANVQTKTEPIGVLDWGHETPLFVVVKNGQPTFVRQIRDGSMRAIIASVARGMELDETTAMTVLSEYGVSADADHHGHELQHTLTQLVSTGVTSLSKELNRTLGFLRGEPELLPQKIWLVGGGATIKNIDALLALHVSADIQTWHRIDDEPQSTMEPLYATAMALSAVGVSR